ncbi:hypothetical protein AB9P05_20545 [Roseivirga sp. BDSF3-8]|uniref:DUF7793 family protein n=1 Tax=Roseivirga sp. BDSF3-8 TaxID=3241598 RepID=UPI003531D632
MKKNSNTCLFENDHIKMWNIDGIAIIEYLDSNYLSLDEADEIMRQLSTLSHHPTPLLIDARGTNYLNRNARNLFSDRVGKHGITAAAIVVNSEIQRKMVNLWLRIDQPDLPFRLFTSKEDAIYYLQFFKNPN